MLTSKLLRMSQKKDKKIGRRVWDSKKFAVCFLNIDWKLVLREGVVFWGFCNSFSAGLLNNRKEVGSTQWQKRLLCRLTPAGAAPKQASEIMKLFSTTSALFYIIMNARFLFESPESLPSEKFSCSTTIPVSVRNHRLLVEAVKMDVERHETFNNHLGFQVFRCLSSGRVLQSTEQLSNSKASVSKH